MLNRWLRTLSTRRWEASSAVTIILVLDPAAAIVVLPLEHLNSLRNTYGLVLACATRSGGPAGTVGAVFFPSSARR